MKIAQKEPCKSIAKQLAEQNPRTKILDSNIKIENIIPGSPAFVPHKQFKPKNTGKGKGKKNIKLSIDSSEMSRNKCTKTKAEWEAVAEKLRKDRPEPPNDQHGQENLLKQIGPLPKQRKPTRILARNLANKWPLKQLRKRPLKHL